MVWVKSSDDHMLDERIQAVDCCADSALRAAYEVCNRIETDGVFYLDQLMTRWSPAKGNRRRLRKAIQDLIGVGLLRQLEHDEALRRYTMAVENEHQFGLQPAKNRHYFAIVDYLKTQPNSDEKRAKREKNRQYMAEYRQKQKDAAVRDLRKKTPDPDPDPELRINDHLIASKEREPASTASPSTPSNVAANMDPGLWLRGEWERRQAHRSTPAKWKPDYQPHLDSIVRKASEATGDTFAILNAALDAFFADPDQQGFGCIPKGLDWKWDQFAGPYLQQAEAVSREQRIAEGEADYQRAKAEYEARADADRKRRQQEANGPVGIGPEQLAALIGSQPRGEG
jgi:hypothetical protein